MTITLKDVLLDDFWIMPATPKYKDSGIPYITSKNIKNGSIDYSNINYISEDDYKLISKNRPIKVGDILISMIGTLGETAVVKDSDGDFYGQNMFLVRLDESKINKEYFLNYFKSEFVKNQLIGKKNKSTQSYLKANHIEELEISVPPLDQQIIIANKLNKIQKLIGDKKIQMNLLDGLVYSKFVELIVNSGENNKLGNYIKRFKAERALDNDYPILSITKEFGIVLQSEKFKKRIASEDTSSYKVVPKGKLVQGIHIDERNFAIQNIIENGIVSPAYKIWDVDESKCNSEVLAYALRSDYIMNYIRSKFTGSIKRRESISYDDFMNTPINLPSLKKQNEFYYLMELINNKKIQCETTLKKLQEMQSALMQEYFG